MAGKRALTKWRVWTDRALACVAGAVLVFGATDRSGAAQSGQTASPSARASAETVAGAMIDTQITATIDGELILDTRHHGIRVRNDAPDRWQTNLVSSHTSAAVILDDAGRWIVRSGEPFSIQAQRGPDYWEVEGTVTALSNATTSFAATARHDGFVIGSQNSTIPDGASAMLRFVDPDHPNRVITLNAVVTRTTGAPSPLEPATLAAKGGDDSSPSEIASYRRMFPPQYPMEAMRDGVNGKVVLRMQIDERGLPLTAEVHSLVPETATMLADAAIAAAMRWRFNPAIKDGQPRGGYVMVPVVFRGAVPTQIAVADDNGHVTLQSPPVAARSRFGYQKISALSYPANAISNKIAGTLFVRVSVRADGSVRDAFVDQAYPATTLALSNAALVAVRDWQFKLLPGQEDGVDRQAIVPIEFRIENDTFSPDDGAAAKVPASAYSEETPRLATIVVLGKPL